MSQPNEILFLNIPPQWQRIADHPGVFEENERYLVALRVSYTSDADVKVWEFHKLFTRFVPGHFTEENGELVEFVTEDPDQETFTDWSWEDFEYYIRVE